MSDHNESEKKSATGREKSEVATREEEILAYWKDRDIFQKTLDKDAPAGEFVFYDGPPFATGTPHYGHILAGTIKDVIPRFKTMQGFSVKRQWGWDTHGLPLENKVEAKLGLETKKDIVDYGIGKFNEEAKDFVLQYTDQWEEVIPRTGRWVDMEHDYRTMDPDYTESIWWAFSKLHKKELIYEGFKSMHICPRCETPLSNFEVNQGYVEQKDISVTVKLPLIDEEDTSLLIWTTTPWTLPGNMAVAVNPELTYAKVAHNGESYIVAKGMIEDVFADKEYELVEEIAGKELISRTYKPPFDYYTDLDIENKSHAWQVYGAEFVTLEEGTGLVHIAPAFGADDLTLAETEGIPIVHHVTESGEFTADVTDFSGLKVKPRDEGGEEHLSADIEILKYLSKHELLFAKENIHHQYPLCWRCETPLLNYATSSWFVEVSSFKDDLVAENEKVGWTPEAIGKNRFGNWLEGARDWAISRERFWGAPLPVWKSEDGEMVEVIGSVEELKEKTQSTNTFLAMRHGEAEMNLTGEINFSQERENPLTDTGRDQAKKAAQKLVGKDINLIFTSPLQRTQETAEVIAVELGVDESNIIEDNRLREFCPGEEFEGKSWQDDYNDIYSLEEQFSQAQEGGETRLDMKRRVGDFLYEVDKKHEHKNILIVSHNGALNMLAAAAEGADLQGSIARVHENKFIGNVGECKQLDFAPLPHNQDYELDFHRPYIDEITWETEAGQTMRRIGSVFDCWFESGSMPYASKHYPFAEDSDFDPKAGKGYPANFVAEGLDQTRGWFYSSLVLGVGLFGESPYENVIVNGLTMAEDGQKMSKSKGNYPPVEEVLDEQGADTLRFFLINSPLVRGENVSVSKAKIDEVMKKVMYRITNTYSFVEMYADAKERTAAWTSDIAADHVLDRWILARLDQLIRSVTNGLENYALDKAAQPIPKFVDDLSTWYLRRSRDRIRGDDSEDKQQALSALLHALEQFSLVLAPFMPFLAERLYQDVTDGVAQESVHLETWPKTQGTPDETLLADMAALREATSHAHDLRSQAELKVRQPLATLTLQNERLKGKTELLEILADEVNVEAIEFDTNIDQPVVLDTDLTDELKEQGVVRELIRTVQRLRKQADLDPAEQVVLGVDTDDVGQKLLQAHQEEVADTANIEEFTFTDLEDGDEVEEHDFSFVLALK